MTRHETQTFQVHANVNSDHGDSALRLTITFYDETGHELLTRTWRKHVRTLNMDGSDWQAYSAATDLCRMMGEIVGSSEMPDAVDEPLPLDGL